MAATRPAHSVGRADHSADKQKAIPHIQTVERERVGWALAR